MIAFAVTVRTERSAFSYTEIGAHCFDVLSNAIGRYGVCKVKVRPA